MKKDQFVVACVEDSASAGKVLAIARRFAERLNHKGLMALHVEGKGATDGGRHWLESLGVPYVCRKDNWRSAIEDIPTTMNGILAVAMVDRKAPRASLQHPATLLKQFRDCKIAYLVIDKEQEVDSMQLEHSVLTLTYRHEGKEKLVWASYLARFMDSRVTIASPHYRDEGLRMRWMNNMRFVSKVFNPLGIEYNTATIGKQTLIDMAAIRELKPDLLVAMTTDPRDRDLLDWLVPVPELALLKCGTPLVLLNPRDDLFILCD